MPTYDFLNTNTNKTEELFMSISEMEEYIKENPHIQIAPAAPAIVSGVNTEQKMDTGWKETLQKISEAHPNSALDIFCNDITSKWNYCCMSYNII